MTIEQMTAQLEAMKLELKEAKRATKTKQAVTAEIHTAKESGKLSIAISQGFRKAYMNIDQLAFIFNNRDSIESMMSQLNK